MPLLEQHALFFFLISIQQAQRKVPVSDPGPQGHSTTFLEAGKRKDKLNPRDAGPEPEGRPRRSLQISLVMCTRKVPARDQGPPHTGMAEKREGRNPKACEAGIPKEG